MSAIALRVEPSRTTGALKDRMGHGAKKQTLEQRDVSVPRGIDEDGDQPIVVTCRDRHSPATGEMLPRAAHQLARIGFLESKHVRDLAIAVIERLTQNERGALRRLKLLQQRQRP